MSANWKLGVDLIVIVIPYRMARMLLGWYYPDNSKESSTSVGELVPNAEAKIVSDNGRGVPMGTTGEFWCPAPTIVK